MRLLPLRQAVAGTLAAVLLAGCGASAASDGSGTAKTARFVPFGRSVPGMFPSPTGTFSSRGIGSAITIVVEPPPSRFRALFTP